LENIILTIFKNKNKSFLSRENVLILITSIWKNYSNHILLLVRFQKYFLK
jgi:hypothetical protein